MEKSYTPKTDIDSCLLQLKWNDRLAVSVGRTRAENCPLIRLSEIYCFPSQENIFAFPTTVRTSRKYEFLPQVNILIRRSLEAGLFQKWRSDSSLYQNDSKQQQICNIILTVAHIGGALLALICGLGLASLAFMAECVAFHKLKQADCHQFWLVLSDILNGRRKVTIRRNPNVVNKNKNRFLPHY